MARFCFRATFLITRVRSHVKVYYRTQKHTALRRAATTLLQHDYTHIISTVLCTLPIALFCRKASKRPKASMERLILKCSELLPEIHVSYILWRYFFVLKWTDVVAVLHSDVELLSPHTRTHWRQTAPVRLDCTHRASWGRGVREINVAEADARVIRDRF